MENLEGQSLAVDTKLLGGFGSPPKLLSHCGNHVCLICGFRKQWRCSFQGSRFLRFAWKVQESCGLPWLGTVWKVTLQFWLSVIHSRLQRWIQSVVSFFCYTLVLSSYAERASSETHSISVDVNLTWFVAPSARKWCLEDYSPHFFGKTGWKILREPTGAILSI